MFLIYNNKTEKKLHIIFPISILQHVSSKKKSFFFPFLPTRGFSSSFFVGVSSSCGLGGFSDYLLGFSIYLLTYTLIYAAHLCLELGVPSSADQRRHLPSSPTVFSYNVFFAFT